MTAMGPAIVLISIAAATCSATIFAHEWQSRRDARRRREAVNAIIGNHAEMSGDARRGGGFSLLAGLASIFDRGRSKRINMARDLPELMDVMRLGIEGGMSFEKSFSLYAERFDTGLAIACRPAARLMSTGVEGREQALGRLADELESTAFKRFAGAVSRSTRYGAPLSPALDELARDMREAARADREEAVAKAPTKMLLPTGVFILPAMLILIAGPFLLELLEQM